MLHGHRWIFLPQLARAHELNNLYKWEYENPNQDRYDPEFVSINTLAIQPHNPSVQPHDTGKGLVGLPSRYAESCPQRAIPLAPSAREFEMELQRPRTIPP